MQAVLLAAGASSRMWPLVEGRHKGLIVVMGKPLIRWTLEALARAGVREAVVVQGPDGAVQDALEAGGPPPLPVHYAVQPEPKGMGDALACAKDALQDRFLLLHPYRFDADALVAPALEKADETGAPFVLCAQPTPQPQHYGILTVEGDRARGLVEKPAPEDAPSDLRVVGVYLLSKVVLDAYAEVAEHEYAFEDALAECMAEHDVRVARIERPIAPLKHPWDVLPLARALVEAHITQDRIDPSAQIDPSAVVKGPVHIGPGARVFERAVVKGPCYLGPNSVVGTGSLVREGSVLEAGVVVGAHCEVTRSLFGAGATTHSGFFGDSVFGPEAKAGAGTITGNVRVDRKQIFAKVKGKRTATGLSSLGAIVGESTHIGIGALLMPGVLIGSHCLIGPGEIVKGSVDSNTRYFNR
mgnify:CR=1 FL=1